VFDRSAKDRRWRGVAVANAEAIHRASLFDALSELAI